jgi:formylglycine-generating enzyme required for sulfatase activity
MAGNVCQGCNDWYSLNYYTHSPATDPPGPRGGQFRVLRGGSWSSHAIGCLSAHRTNGGTAYRDSGIGFRVSKTP